MSSDDGLLPPRRRSSRRSGSVGRERIPQSPRPRCTTTGSGDDMTPRRRTNITERSKSAGRERLPVSPRERSRKPLPYSRSASSRTYAVTKSNRKLGHTSDGSVGLSDAPPYNASSSLNDSDVTNSKSSLPPDFGYSPAQLWKALQEGSWKALYDLILKWKEDSPDTLVNALALVDAESRAHVLHTAVWKAPPALAVYLVELVQQPRDQIAVFTAQDADGNTPLHLLCANFSPQSLTVLKLLVEAASRSLELQNSHGDTPLHLLVSSDACCCDVVEDATIQAVSCLCLAETDVALSQDLQGATPLHTAICSGAHEKVLTMLLEAEPKAQKVTDEVGMLPLHYAAAMGTTSTKIVEKLIFGDAICAVTLNGDTPLHLLASNASNTLSYLNESAMSDDTREMIELLVGSGLYGDVEDDESEDVRQPLLIFNSEKLNPLHCCALFSAPAQIAQVLMSNPNGPRAATMVNEYGATPLHLACAQTSVADSVAIIEALGTVEAAAVLDRHKRTPLHVAAQNRCATGTLIDVLTELHMDACSIKTQRGHLPLHLAAQSQVHESVIKALIQAYPAGAEARNKTNNTPLADAAKYHASLEVVQALLDAYPDAIYADNQYGNLPLHCATASQAPGPVVQLLLKAWPDAASMQNRNQDSPLHYAAAFMTSVETVEQLIQAAPATVLLLNSSGQSPMDRAEANGAPQEIIDLLQKSAEEWSKKAVTDGWGSFAGEYAKKAAF